jgi:hypothetical protein
MNTYRWATATNHGVVSALSAQLALQALVAEEEWGAPHSARERYDIAHGDFLCIQTANGARVLTCGRVPKRGVQP